GGVRMRGCHSRERNQSFVSFNGHSGRGPACAPTLRRRLTRPNLRDHEQEKTTAGAEGGNQLAGRNRTGAVQLPTEERMPVGAESSLRAWRRPWTTRTSGGRRLIGGLRNCSAKRL